jgi:ADP-ribose pyrophosphatase YjhB (NUDIX family)
MGEIKLRLNANAIVTNSENKILIIQLKKGPFAGKLSIPGGGINPGELSHETVKRELFEEAGIILNNLITPFGFCELVHKGLGSHRIVTLLESKSNNEISESDEGIPKWYSLEELELLGEELLPFAKESIRIWKNKENYFQLVTE